MSIRQDVFGLEQVYRLQVEGLWSAKSDVWLVPSPYYVPAPETGYFGGGAGGSPDGDYSTVDRIDYSNDTATASPKGPLSISKRGWGSTGNSSFGYFGGGGGVSPIVPTVNRIDYATDTTTASPKGPLSSSRYYTGATGNSSYGYFGGGLNPAASPNTFSTVDRIDYSNDTATASPKGPLSLARNSLGATSAAANGLPQ